MSIPFKDVIIIPQKATFEVLDKTYVFVIDKNNVVKQKEITIGAELPHLFIISKGLSQNDTILLEGIKMVKNNQKIETKFLEPTKVMSELDLYAE
jgi:membrane fusion protein (multidrug efflux system)